MGLGHSDTHNSVVPLVVFVPDGEASHRQAAPHGDARAAYSASAQREEHQRSSRSMLDDR